MRERREAERGNERLFLQGKERQEGESIDDGLSVWEGEIKEGERGDDRLYLYGKKRQERGR